ncbi:tRNA pseudouridine(55) synthase TruB [Bacillaceae bacterium S4-13-58]
MNGILPLWKERGLTSHDCVMRLRKILKMKAIGHTGTLDPEVEGVLPICIGRATKVAAYLTDSPKEYEAQVTIGTATETEDQTGEIIEKTEDVPWIDKKEILAVLQTFVGEITQVPPMYSAVKVNGKRLYEYAREGKIVKRPERKVTIYNISLISDPFKDNDGFHFSIKVKCSKGTYIRTLCVDIGKTLGYPSHMSKLVRTKAGGFDISHTMTLEEVKQKLEENKLEESLYPMDRGVEHLPFLKVNETVQKQVMNGRVLPIPENIPKSDPFRMIGVDGTTIALYQRHPEKQGLIKPVRVF